MRWEFRGDVGTEGINWEAVSVKGLLKAMEWDDITGGRHRQKMGCFSFGSIGERIQGL